MYSAVYPHLHCGRPDYMINFSVDSVNIIILKCYVFVYLGKQLKWTSLSCFCAFETCFVEAIKFCHVRRE